MLPSLITCPYSYHNIYATFKLLLACLSLSPLENKLPRDQVLRLIHCCFLSTQCSTCDTRETQYILLLNWVKCSLLPRRPPLNHFSCVCCAISAQCFCVTQIPRNTKTVCYSSPLSEVLEDTTSWWSFSSWEICRNCYLEKRKFGILLHVLLPTMISLWSS